MNPTIYLLPELERAIGLKRSTIYAMIAAGTFPKPLLLGKRAVGWPEVAIKNWLESRPTNDGRGASHVLEK